MPIQYAGQYDVKELLVYTSSGVVFNLRNAIQSINIYESMFSTSLSGSITILDVDDIATLGPIIGQEYMKLRLTTPDLDEDEIDFTNTTFAIYKVVSRISGSQNAQLLTLSFTTPELLKNNRTRLSRSYTDTIDNIVESVLTDETSINTIKNIYIEETSGIRKIIAPNINPYNFITNLATEALSKKYGSPHFFFFENTKGIHFKSIESMLSGDGIGLFTVSDLGPLTENGTVDIQKDFERVREFQINTNNDMLMNITGGMLGSRDIEYNIYNKSYKTREYKYFDDFDKYPRLNGGAVYNDNQIDVEGNTVGDFSNARIHLHSVSSQDELDTQHTNEKSEYKYAPNKINESILQRQAKFMELNSGISVSMKIAGNTTIAAGQKMRLVVPTTGRVHEGNEFDPYYTGDYLITKLRHNFSQTDKTHEIYLQASQESFETDLPNKADAKEPLGSKGVVTNVTY